MQESQHVSVKKSARMAVTHEVGKRKYFKQKKIMEKLKCMKKLFNPFILN